MCIRDRDCSDLIVRIHNGNQDRILPDRRFQLFQIDDPVFVHIQISDLKTFLFQIFACMQDRMMLDLTCDQMFPLGCICPVSYTHLDVYKRQSVDRAHDTCLDRCQVVQRLSHRCQTVCCTGSCGDDVIIFCQFLVVYIVYDCRQIVSSRCGNNNVFSCLLYTSRCV